MLLATGCKSDPADCKNYFSGKWKYKIHAVDKIYVVRTLEQQIEYVADGKYHYDFDIKWISDCKYEIKYKGTNNPKPAVAKIGETTTVEILAAEKNKMTYQTYFRDLQQVGEMERIN